MAFEYPPPFLRGTFDWLRRGYTYAGTPDVDLLSPEALRADDPWVVLAATIERDMAGPALSAAATPVRTKMPVPMIAPTPRLVNPTGPRTRRSRFSPLISSISDSNDFVAHNWLPLLMRKLRRACRGGRSATRVWVASGRDV